MKKLVLKYAQHLRNCLLVKYIMISYVGDQFQTMSLIAQPGYMALEWNLGHNCIGEN